MRETERKSLDMNQQQRKTGFAPVQRTDKRPDHYEYVYDRSQGKKVPVLVGAR
jgi:hypothetical protein